MINKIKKEIIVMIKINGYVSFKATVESVESDKIYLLLEDGCKGLLYYFDLPNYMADMSHIFRNGQAVYVRKKVFFSQEWHL